MYDIQSPHPDPILHAKLQQTTDLLNVDVDHLTEHFYGSRFSYSTQALPVNVLLDTLIRPYGETDEAERKTCVKWVHDPSRAVPHLVVGKASQTGGQWAENPVEASWDIGALSYAGMLSLPGYSFEQYYLDKHGQNAPFYLRPTRRDVAGYFADYPQRVGIAGAMFSNEELSGISRTQLGFHVSSHNIVCRHLVLASGTFTSLIPPRPLLQPLLKLDEQSATEEPLLVVGSGFSAADVILSTPRHQKILHIYKWAPQNNPSPLRACHQQAYPEYAGVYKRMKLAAVSKPSSSGRRPSSHRRPSQLDLSRDWDTSYEGLPNTAIIAVEQRDGHAVVTLKNDQQVTFQRSVGAFAYVVGRRGSLSYLDNDLAQEVCGDTSQTSLVAGTNLREKVSENLEVAPNVFVTGSLTGDSLIRFAYGGCAFAAGNIIAQRNKNAESQNTSRIWKQQTRSRCGQAVPVMSGIQGHEIGTCAKVEQRSALDRRKSEVLIGGI